MNADNKSEAVIPIKGMHCASCVGRIESGVGALRGVESVNVSLPENKALVRFDPDTITLDEIKRKIISLGYSPGTKMDEKRSGFLQGLVYGLVPHAGCIAFIAASVIGATAAMNFFKPLLLHPYFFSILVGLSVTFASVSSVLYLQRNGILSVSGARRKWKYLSVMFTSTIGVNLLVLMVVFPLLAQASISSGGTGVPGTGLSSLTLRVDIPCAGHAPLISGELQSLEGVIGVNFRPPDLFEVVYDPLITTEEDIRTLPVFAQYKATVEESSGLQTPDSQKSGGCCGGCGGSCGGCRP